MPVRRLSSLTVSTLLVAVAGLTALGQEQTLRLKFAANEQLHYRSTTESNVTMSGIPGMGDMTVTNVMSQTFSMTTENVAADGAVTLRTTFDTIRMDTSSPMVNMSYDSTSATPPSDPNTAEVARTLGALVGESITLVITPTGTVRSVDGMKKIKEKLSNTPAMANAAAMMGGNPMDSMMSDEAMRATFSQGFASFPDRAVKPGDTWKNEITVPNPMGTQTVTSTFTLKGIEQVEGREFTKIAVTQTIKTASGGTVGPFAIEAGDATGEGEILFDHKSGRVERATIETTMPMTMSMSGPDGSTMSLQSLTHTKSTFGLDKR